MCKLSGGLGLAPTRSGRHVNVVVLGLMPLLRFTQSRLNAIAALWRRTAISQDGRAVALNRRIALSDLHDRNTLRVTFGNFSFD